MGASLFFKSPSPFFPGPILKHFYELAVSISVPRIYVHGVIIKEYVKINTLCFQIVIPY